MHAIMTAEKDMEIWTGAYNAALTGFVIAKAEKGYLTAQNVRTVTEQCTSLADQAVKDAQQHSKRQ
jgi:hypothetical protein